MRGVVIATTMVAVEPITAPAGRGFTTGPWPSPTRGGVSFRFSLLEAGPVRAEVFDAGGRRVAVVVTGSYPAGTYVASWDGRAAGGDRARAGIYYLRLDLPGFAGARRVVVVR